MEDDTVSTEFYWDNIVIKVEDKLFCVPRCEFVKSSEVFADMFLLPSGPATRSEGRDREHPIILEGYKKDEFSCLLKVMYPTAESLISGTNIELNLGKEEWVSVLKLSTIWGMNKIRKYAIHRLSTDVVLSPTEKVLLARAHKVAAWLDEGVTSLVNGDPTSTLEDLSILGWETVAQVLWIKDKKPPPDASNTLHFTKDTIKCGYCTSSSSLINSGYNCPGGHIIAGDQELNHAGLGSASGATDRLIVLRAIRCSKCGNQPFYSTTVHCATCSRNWNYNHNVRITPKRAQNEMIQQIFGEEIKEHELASTLA